MSQVRSATQGGNGEAGRDLVSALSGTEAARDSAVGERTRRVVLASLGQILEQKAGRRQSRAVALAILLVVVLCIGPFVWRLVEDLTTGEHMADLATQFSMLLCIFCPAMLGAILVAGWLRRHP